MKRVVAEMIMLKKEIRGKGEKKRKKKNRKEWNLLVDHVRRL